MDHKDTTIRILMKSLNKIDDYFEYRYKRHTQEENKQFVYDVLELTNSILCSQNQETNDEQEEKTI